MGIDAKDPIIWALLGWALKELFQTFKDKSKNSSEALQKNTIAIYELKGSVDRLDGLLDEAIDNVAEHQSTISKMQRDLDVAHTHIRMIKPDLYNPPQRN